MTSVDIPDMTAGDIVGAGINFVTGKAFFTKNGELIGWSTRVNGS